MLSATNDDNREHASYKESDTRNGATNEVNLINETHQSLAFLDVGSHND
jgi:hypothetical protein